MLMPREIPREITRGMPREIPRATLRRQNPGVIAVAVAGRRARCRNNCRRAPMFRSTRAVPRTRRRSPPAKGRGRLSLRPGWPVSHPARAAGAVGRRTDRVRSSRRIPAGKARASPKRLPGADHSRSPGRSEGLGRAVRATGGHPTVRHRKGSRAATVRASRVNGLQGRVAPAREGRIDAIRPRTLGGGGTGDRAADRREEAGKLR